MTNNWKTKVYFHCKSKIFLKAYHLPQSAHSVTNHVTFKIECNLLSLNIF